MISSLDHEALSALDYVALTLAIRVVKPSVEIVKQLHYYGRWMTTPVDQREKFFLNQMQSFIWWRKKFWFPVLVAVIAILYVCVAIKIYVDYKISSFDDTVKYLFCIVGFGCLIVFIHWNSWRDICKEVATFEKLFLVYHRAREHVMARGQAIVKSRLFTESCTHLDADGTDAFWRSVPEIDEFYKFYD